MGIAIYEGEAQLTLIWANSALSKQVTCSLGAKYQPGAMGLGGINGLCETVYIGLVGDDSAHLCNASNMASGWSFLGVEGTLIVDGEPVLGAYLDTVAGSGSDNDVPVNCAVLISKQTAAGGRRNRGRMFVPPIFSALETDTNGALINVGTSFLDANMAELLEHCDNDEVDLLLLHSSSVPPPADPIAVPGTKITGFSTSGTLATQRRRLR